MADFHAIEVGGDAYLVPIYLSVSKLHNTCLVGCNDFGENVERRDLGIDVKLYYRFVIKKVFSRFPAVFGRVWSQSFLKELT